MERPKYVMQNSILLNQDEVADILKVSTKTLEYYRWKGIGPRYIKLGKLVRYRECDIRLFIEQLADGDKIESC